MAATICPATVREGTYEITGAIIALWYRERPGKPYGAAKRSHAVMAVELDDGAVVCGTVPRSIESALIPVLYMHRDRYSNLNELIVNGRASMRDGEPAPAELRVRLTATFEKSRDRDGFAFYRNPRNAHLLIGNSEEG